MDVILMPSAIVVRGYLPGLPFAVIIFGACEVDKWLVSTFEFKLVIFTGRKFTLQRTED